PGAVRPNAPTPGPRLLAGHAPEDRHRPGPAARPGAGCPRRADRRARPADAARVLQPARRAARGGPNHLLLVPRSVRSGARVRPPGDRASGPHWAPAARRV